MAEYGAIVNLVNSFALWFSFENSDDSIQHLLHLFVDDATLEDELVGVCNGKAEIETGLKELSGLTFLADTHHVPSGHVVEVADASRAKVVSTTTVSWRCVPVMVIQWTDQVVKADGKWLFLSRKAEALQKNLEMIGEMQLRGKKRYSHQVDA